MQRVLLCLLAAAPQVLNALETGFPKSPVPHCYPRAENLGTNYNVTVSLLLWPLLSTFGTTETSPNMSALDKCFWQTATLVGPDYVEAPGQAKAAPHQLGTHAAVGLQMNNIQHYTATICHTCQSLSKQV